MTALLPELGSVRLRETERELVIEVEVEVPAELDLAQLSARIRGGVLEIRVPRAADGHRLAGFHPEATGV